MNCEETRSLMAGYLDNELHPHDAGLIKAHVRDCSICKSEMALMWRTRGQITQLMQAHLDRVSAPPDAWERLQTALAAPPEAAVVMEPGAPRRDPLPSGETPQVKPSLAIGTFSFSLLALIVILFVGLIIVPGLLPGSFASLGRPENATREAHTDVPAGEGEVMTPTPTILPGAGEPRFVPLFSLDGLFNSEAQSDPATGALRYAYYGGTDFMILTQQIDTTQEPPEGCEPLNIFPGCLETELSGTEAFEDGAITMRYENGLRLTWFVEDTRLEALTSLPAEKLYTFAEGVALSTPHYEPTYQPPEFYASQGVIGVERGLLVSEDRYYSGDRFIVLTQRHIALDPAMPQGEPVAIGPAEGVLIGGQAGTVHIAGDVPFQDEVYRRVVISSEGSSSRTPNATQEPQDRPVTLEYTDGVRLVWAVGEVRFDLLTNVPLEQALVFAEGLQITWTPEFHPYTQPDLSAIPTGRGMPFYSAHPGPLPEDFYGSVELLVYDEARGILMEKRFFGNEQFIILTSEGRSRGSTLAGGEPVRVSGVEGIMQTGLSGTAGIGLETYPTLQDGVERPMLGGGGGGGGSSENEMLFPEEIAYENGTLIEWRAQGARVTLLTNLPTDQALAAAESVSITTEYMFFHPINQGAMRISAPPFVPLAPSHLPDGFDGFSGAQQVAESIVLELLYLPIQEDDPRFYYITQQPASPGEALPDGERISVRGSDAIVEEGIGGALPMDGFLYDMPAREYADAVRVTFIRGGVRVEVLAVDSVDEVLNVVGGLSPVE